MITINGKYTSADIMIDNVEESCIKQIYEMVNHSAFTNPIVIMPDCHAGKGSCIGFTMKITEKVIPNVVSVDVGCGIASVRVSRVGEIDHDKVDREIREKIPFGRNWHDKDSKEYKRNLKLIKKLLDKYYEIE